MIAFDRWLVYRYLIWKIYNWPLYGGFFIVQSLYQIKTLQLHNFNCKVPQFCQTFSHKTYSINLLPNPPTIWHQGFIKSYYGLLMVFAPNYIVIITASIYIIIGDIGVASAMVSIDVSV